MKFELLTPPLSPCRDSSCASSPVCLSSSSIDTLQCVTDIIDGDNCRTFVELEHNCANLTSKLIQDCMWGSHSSQEKNSSKQVDNAYDTPCSSPPPFYPIDTVGAECVDPTSVFPHHIHTQEFPSGESSEEEIDVVSVEKPVKRKCPEPCSNINVNKNTVKALRNNIQPIAKRPRMNLKRQQQANKENKVESAQKRPDLSIRLNVKDKSTDDPECKRNVHNVLERKRRNDLKYSFQLLRDSMPELKGYERTPKVAILRKATDCISKLTSEQERLLEDKTMLEKRKQSLHEKLRRLKQLS
ncbi:myc proto-oncogene protein-like [Xenia sp. Carnegie-2017]|uniref:myc proto-oncogene protein-like n=1 Tax=Xenia sp. Carnegie-2017 TaxID=2897299 RepID=UPI001F03A297|nr:myc proto-oncogene protein-like [Xenia sp. Carnegie-2017]